jgi:hypothetical protein
MDKATGQQARHEDAGDLSNVPPGDASTAQRSSTADTKKKFGESITSHVKSLVRGRKPNRAPAREADFSRN